MELTQLRVWNLTRGPRGRSSGWTLLLQVGFNPFNPWAVCGTWCKLLKSSRRFQDAKDASMFWASWVWYLSTWIRVQIWFADRTCPALHHLYQVSFLCWWLPSYRFLPSFAPMCSTCRTQGARTLRAPLTSSTGWPSFGTNSLATSPGTACSRGTRQVDCWQVVGGVSLLQSVFFNPCATIKAETCGFSAWP